MYMSKKTNIMYLAQLAIKRFKKVHKLMHNFCQIVKICRAYALLSTDLIYLLKRKGYVKKMLYNF